MDFTPTPDPGPTPDAGDAAAEHGHGAAPADAPGLEPLLLLVGRDARLPAACRGLCDLLDYELLTVADAETLVETLRRRRPAAVACGQRLVGITPWFVLARLAHAGCDCDVVVAAPGIDPDLRAAFENCRALLGLSYVTTLGRRLSVDDIARLLAAAGLRRRKA